MLDADLFGFFGFDGRRGVDERFGSSGAVLIVDVSLARRAIRSATYIFDFLHGEIGVRGNADGLRLHVDDDE